jgi:poly(A) polymerase/tRNA nucleotidyltransferase (CCA-adding enzyme)
MGAILDVLLSEVLEDPELNNREVLLARANGLKDFNLSELREKAKEVIEEKREEEDIKIKRKYLKK